MTATLAQTPLHGWHAAHGARLVDFAGWSMPVQYASIVAEHQATRTTAGLFDVSHMARIRFDGPAAESFLDRLVTRRIAGMAAGQIRYALVTNHEGGILDDVLVYHLIDRQTGESYYQMVANASNRRKILTWIEANLGHGAAPDFADRTHETAMISVQGPRAHELLKPLSAGDPLALKYYTGVETDLAGAPGILSRTGYTGEDGWELIVPADGALGLWESLVQRGAELGVMAAGLGARDTLRLEAGMPLYGHELTEEIDPFQAGLAFAVDLEDHDFPGRDALDRLRRDPDRPRRAGLELSGRRVPREGYAISAAGAPAGYVTSGTFSPSLNKPIAMAYLRRDLVAAGTQVDVDVRGQSEGARVVKLPFYRRKT
jgi:aminomethyltransferase